MSKSVYAWRQTFGPRRGETINVACHFLSSSSSHRINLCQHRLHHSSLMLQFVYRCLPASNSGHIRTPPPLSAFLSLFLLTHFGALHLFCLSVSVCILLLVVPPPLLYRSPRTAVFTLCLFVSFSSSGGWRRVSPPWLPRGCCGNNSCHFVVQKVTEKNEKRGGGKCNRVKTNL